MFLRKLDQETRRLLDLVPPSEREEVENFIQVILSPDPSEEVLDFQLEMIAEMIAEKINESVANSAQPESVSHVKNDVQSASDSQTTSASVTATRNAIQDGRPAMSKWEYLIVSRDDSLTLFNGEPQTRVGSNQTIILKPWELLSHLGREGWEAVSFREWPSERLATNWHCYGVFKRPRS
jgi:hypothetical protein